MKKIATVLATSIAAFALAALPASPASATPHHYCGSGSHYWTYEGQTWRDRLVRDEGTRHTYRIEYYYDAPWYVLFQDGWKYNGTVYRQCYNGGWV